VPNWFANNAFSIGHTPLVRLNRIIDGAPATVLSPMQSHRRVRDRQWSRRSSPRALPLPCSPLFTEGGRIAWRSASRFCM
jgi:hypothetical protein